MGYPLFSCFIFQIPTHTTITANVKKKRKWMTETVFFLYFFYQQRIVTYNFWCDVTLNILWKKPKTLQKKMNHFLYKCLQFIRETIQFSLFRVLWRAKKIESNLKSGKKHRDKKKQVKIVCDFLNWKIAFALLFFYCYVEKKK